MAQSIYVEERTSLTCWLGWVALALALVALGLALVGVMFARSAGVAAEVAAAYAAMPRRRATKRGSAGQSAATDGDPSQAWTPPPG